MAQNQQHQSCLRSGGSNSSGVFSTTHQHFKRYSNSDEKFRTLAWLWHAKPAAALPSQRTEVKVGADGCGEKYALGENNARCV
jgi:hypothetical protein